MSGKQIFVGGAVFIGILAVIIVIVKSGWLQENDQIAESKKAQQKFSVVTSFYPLFFFASEIAGDKADVSVIVPAGAEPHEYEPTPKERANIEKSTVLIVNGGGLEPWEDAIRSSIQGTKIKMIVAGDGLFTRTLERDGEMTTDPHIWLSLPIAEKIAERIANGFTMADADNANTYRENAARLIQSLADLDEEYRYGLANCERRDIVTSHVAFGYLADAYGLNQVAIAGISPDEEPSPKQLTDVAEFARAHHVKYIFFEKLASPKLSETIANEVGAQTLVLNPIEGLSREEQSAGANYITVMRENLHNLQTALACR